VIFTKMQGTGNDFVIIDAVRQRVETDLPELARKMCHRNFGVGADGLILVLPSRTADIQMRIFNADGSEPEMCGNGIRCFAKFVYTKGLVEKTTMNVETLAGTIIPELQLQGNEVTGVRVNMGEPILERSRIPMAGDGPSPVLEEQLAIGQQHLTFSAVSMGNPHCVIFVPDVEAVPLNQWGPQIETHSLFPRKTNVEFAQVLGPERVRMRVWERGAGPTMACGTGACAVTVAGVLTGRTSRQVTVELPGGSLTIHWDNASNRVYMTGPAEEIFTGEFRL